MLKERRNGTYNYIGIETVHPTKRPFFAMSNVVKVAHVLG